MLGELAEFGMGLARDLQQAALATDDVAEKCRLADTFHRVSRGVRQSLALHAKLERDAKRGVVEDRADARSETALQVTRRRTQTKAAIERLVWTEYEDLEDPEELLELLESLLATEAASEGFLDQDPDALIETISAQLGLGPPARRVQGAVVEPHAPSDRRNGRPYPDSAFQGEAAGSG